MTSVALQPDLSDWISGIATAAYLVFTSLIIWESRAARRSQHQPVLVGHISRPNQDQTDVYLCIENIGNSAAFDLKLLKETADSKQTSIAGVPLQVKATNWKGSIPGVGPSQYLVILECKENSPYELGPFSAECSYTNAAGKRMKSMLVHFASSNFSLFIGSSHPLTGSISNLSSELRGLKECADTLAECAKNWNRYS